MRPVGHIRQRSCGSWELRYSIGRSSETGRRRVATVTVRGTRKDAERELRRLLRTQDTGEHVDPTRMTAAQWLNQWLGLIRDSVSGKTYERYAELANNFLIPEFGQVRLSRLTPAQIQASYAKWSMEGRRDGKPGGLSPLTRRHIHRVLRSALTRAVELQIIARNPSDPLRKTLPKVERREMKTLSDDQTNSLLGILSDSRLYWPCLIAVGCDEAKYWRCAGSTLILTRKRFEWSRAWSRQKRLSDSRLQRPIDFGRLSSLRTRSES